MSAPKATPVECEKFRRLIERAGIVEAVTRALVRVHEERLAEPERAMDLFREQIAAEDRRLDAARGRIVELETRLAALERHEQ